MKPEENLPAPASLLDDHDGLRWRLWCVTMAAIIVGGLLWGGVLVVNYPRTYPAADDQRATIPPVTVRPGGRVVRSREDVAARELSSATIAAPGTVWVNTKSGVYHFPGYHWYGRTLRGKYVNEEDAIAEGDRAAKNERRPPQSETVKQ